MATYPYSVAKALSVIDQAVEQFKLKAIYALFSGGHDSLVSTHVAFHHHLFAGVVFIDTGTGLKETRQFVDETCKTHGWEMHVGKGAWSYEQLIIAYGFPGPASHNYMYRYLKERPLEAMRQELARKHATIKTITRGKSKGNVKSIPGNIGFVTGIRQEESLQRMGVVEPFHKQKSIHWIAPLFDWSKLQCTQYITDHQMKRSIVGDMLGMSGECFCGSHARPDERRVTETLYPEQGKRIEGWEKLVKVATEIGYLDVPQKRQCWGGDRSISPQQIQLFPLCHYCRGHMEDAED